MASSPTHQETAPAEAAKAAVSRLFQLLRIERQALYVVTVYSIGIGLASLAAPIGVQMLVSAIAFGGLVQPIIILSLLVLVALTVAAMLRATQAWVIERLQQRLFVRVAADLAERLPRVGIRSFEDAHGPELVNRFFDVLTLQKGAAMLLLDGVLVALQVVVGGLLLALYHPALLGFATAVLIAALAVIFGMGRRGSSTSIKESKSKYALVAWFEEMARHPTIFRDHVGAGFAIQKSHALTRDYVSYRGAHFKVVFRQTVAFLALQAFATAALLGIGGTLVLSGQLTLGQLVAAELILTGVVAGFAKFGKYLESYYDLIAAMDKLGHLVDLPLEPTSTGRLPRVKGPLQLRLVDAEYNYPDGTGGLAKVSLEVPAGARVAVVGPNGSGKSTLIDLIYGLREPARGHIEINGLPLRDLALGDVREHVALVRGAAIFEGTMLDNVCMGRPSITLEDVRRALEIVGLWTEVTNLPEGLSTHISTNGGNLSTGQAQRLAIARAIVVKPSCLLLDEALDHLDPASRRFILKRILGEHAPWTVIVATHDPEVAESCSHSFALDQPKLRPVTRSEDSK
jgi:putative ABC transport system ATP-binding protein